MLACSAALALTGCGAREAEVVKGAFDKSIDSATVSMAMTVQAPDATVKVGLDGPYKSNGQDKLPSADMKLSVTGALPRAIEGRIISTGDNAFVEYGGEMYEVGKDTISQLMKQQGASGSDELSPADINKLMDRVQDWFPESDTQEDADLEGEPVTRVTGELDLAKALEDLKELANQPGMSGFEEFKELSQADLKEAEKMVSDPKFTIDVGRDDGKLRRIVASMRIDDGKDSGAIEFSMRFKDVDKPVDIQAPTSGKPINELLERLGRDFGGVTGAPQGTIS
jgi:hypothetical protein